MSIRHGLLALLERGPRYGSQLRTEFESRTGSTWPLNVGQVYTTLNRLERDGMVAQGGEDTAGHALYAITDSGRAELRTWFERPVDRTSPARDELAIKLAMAVGAPGVDIRHVIQSQRRHTVQAMQDYTRLKAQALVAVESGGARERDDVAWLLVLEQLIFQTEAEARWLDHCESRLIRLSALDTHGNTDTDRGTSTDAGGRTDLGSGSGTGTGMTTGATRTAAPVSAVPPQPVAEAAPPVGGAR
ncbi:MULTISPECIES: PadR family transcriptional regulator [unclassified Streptomyces]|uniref:PadR family transcriptional regulator n=1 Tax=unclassified Streptomyces TaxID=2593676 RepID=UPI0006FDDF5E|nr:MULTISPECIES: PadR family transcriptional regulator [unclassified Streptomyces]KQX49542.1 PadR family transcriptional regulator [Streptomyces sp. Root1304]KRA79161.1 PadR family transcriptional regulator [Streptomyces sp. Root66D1]